MKKMINKTHIEGTLYEIVESKVAPSKKDPTNQYARGTIAIEVTEDNITEWDFLVMEYTTNKQTQVRTKNANFALILNVLSSPTVVKDGREFAASIKVDSALDLNDFYSIRNNEAAFKLRSFGGFNHLVASPNPSSTFEVDMLITSTTEELKKDVDGVQMPTGSLFLNGLIFNYKKEAMPVKFLIENANGIKYFAALPANTFTKVWGNMKTQVETTTVTEESAFGEAKVVDYTQTRKKYIVTGVSKIPYEFGEDSVLTVDEVSKALAARNVKLETIKADTIQREANKAQEAPAAAPSILTTPGATPAATTFNF